MILSFNALTGFGCISTPGDFWESSGSCWWTVLMPLRALVVFLPYGALEELGELIGFNALTGFGCISTGLSRH